MNLPGLKYATLFATAMALSSTSYASGNVEFGAGVSTLGIGVIASYDVTDSFVIRGQVNRFTYDRDFTEDEIKYDADLKLSSLGLIGDWYPMDASGFRVSAGAYYNGNELSADGKPKSGEDYDIGDGDYELDSLKAEMDFNSFAPYLGVGWSSKTPAEEGFSFSADLGVLYQGSADLTLSATGTGAGDPGFNEDLKKEEEKLEDEVKKYRWYPVIAVSTTYRF